MDDDRKTPFFEDRHDKPQPHVTIPKRTREEAEAGLAKFRQRTKWEDSQKEAKAPDRSPPKAAPVERGETPPPKASERVYTFNPGPGLGPTVAGRRGAPSSEEYARVREPTDARAAAEAFKAAMAEPKPQAAPEPKRPGAPIVSRRGDDETWKDIREARAFPLTSRPAELRELETDMSAATRRRKEDAGHYERAADRLHARWER